jgi:outer membrane protein
MAGGNLAFNLHKTNDYYEYEEKTTSFNVKPVVGYFITKNVALGISGEFNFFEDDEDEYDTQSTKTLSLQIFARYQANISQKFKLYIDPYIGRTYYLKDDEEEKRHEFNTGADFGLLYFVSKKFSLELNLMEISWYKQTRENSDELQREFNISYDIVQPNFGMRFYF